MIRSGFAACSCVAIGAHSVVPGGYGMSATISSPFSRAMDRASGSVSSSGRPRVMKSVEPFWLVANAMVFGGTGNVATASYSWVGT